jgi:hypothetical protein
MTSVNENDTLMDCINAEKNQCVYVAIPFQWLLNHYSPWLLVAYGKQLYQHHVFVLSGLEAAYLNLN